MQNRPIGILSGTFDPIHLGHLHLATTIYQWCNLQRIILIPCYQSPLRSPPIATAMARFNLAKLAVEKLPYLSVDDYEIKNPTKSYTIKTLRYLSQKITHSPLALIMGSDVLNRLDEWSEWQKIVEIAHLIVINRSHHDQITNKKILELLSQKQVFTKEQLQKKSAGLIYYTNINPLPIAATEIRRLIKQGEDPASHLPPKVWQSIYEKKLYLN